MTVKFIDYKDIIKDNSKLENLNKEQNSIIPKNDNIITLNKDEFDNYKKSIVETQKLKQYYENLNKSIQQKEIIKSKYVHPNVAKFLGNNVDNNNNIFSFGKYFKYASVILSIIFFKKYILE